MSWFPWSCICHEAVPDIHPEQVLVNTANFLQCICSLSFFFSPPMSLPLSHPCFLFSCWSVFKPVSVCAGLKPYVCTVCDYAGRSKSNLKTHMNRHNTEKRHLCDLCGKKFKSKVTLKSHRLSHTNEGTHTLLCSWWWLFILKCHCCHLVLLYNWLCSLCVCVCVATFLLEQQKPEKVESKGIILFVQGNGFSVRSVTSRRSLNRPYSGTWSNMLNSRYVCNVKN